MAIGIKFSKARAEEVLQCIQNGKPIPPGVLGWSQHDMLLAAGALFFGAMSQGPMLSRDKDFSDLPREHKEAKEETWFEDLHAAIEFYGQLFMQVKDEDYDAFMEPEMMAIVTNEKKVYPVLGFKQTE